MYKNYDILNPVAYTPSDSEIALAKANHVMKNYLYGMVENLSKFYELNQTTHNFKPTKQDRIKQLANNTFNDWKEIKDKLNTHNLFDSFISDEQFNHTFVNSLSSMHLGDCVSFPMTCDRCYAENLFNLPSSVSYTQAEGAVLLEEFLKDYEEKNGQKYAIDE